MILKMLPGLQEDIASNRYPSVVRIEKEEFVQFGEYTFPLRCFFDSHHQYLCKRVLIGFSVRNDQLLKYNETF